MRKTLVIIVFILLICLAGTALASPLPYGIYLQQGTEALRQNNNHYVLVAGECLSAETDFQPFDKTANLDNQGRLIQRATFKISWSYGEVIAKNTELASFSALFTSQGEQPFTPGRHYLLIGFLQPYKTDDMQMVIGFHLTLAGTASQTINDAQWAYQYPLPETPCFVEISSDDADNPLESLQDTPWHRYPSFIALARQSGIALPLDTFGTADVIKLQQGDLADLSNGSCLVSDAFAKQNKLSLGDEVHFSAYPLVFTERIALGENILRNMDVSRSLMYLTHTSHWADNAPQNSLKIVGIYTIHEDAPWWIQNPNVIIVR